MVESNRAEETEPRDDLSFDEMLEELTSRDEHHATRESESREGQSRPTEWKPSSLLPQPNPKEGYDFRYIRSMARGVADTINVSQALREGWVLCDAVDFPELFVIPNPQSMYPGKVDFGDLLLSMRPCYIGEQLRENANREMQAQMDGLESNYFKDQHPGSNMAKVRFGD